MQILTRSHNNTNTHGNGWMGDFCSECICPTNVLHRKEGRKEGENLKERKKEGTATEREGERVKLTTGSSLELLQESVSCCLLRPLLTTEPFKDGAFTAYRKLTMVRWPGERVDVYANKIRQLAGLAGFEGAGLEKFTKLAFVTGFPNAI